MEASDNEGRMLPFTRNTWEAFVPGDEKPIDFLLKKNIPVYFKVDQARHLVGCSYRQTLHPMDDSQRKQIEKISWVSATADQLDAIELSRRGLHESIAYLRMDNASLEEVAHSGACRTPRFSGFGLALTRKYRVVGNDSRGRPIKEAEEITTVSDLVRAEFEKAFVIDKAKWDEARALTEPGMRIDSLEFSAKVLVKKEDLFLDAWDIARLMRESLPTIKRVAYPFRHEERMPGLYWMFQAAYTRNELDDVKGGDRGIATWLTDNAPKTYRYKSLRTAEKFVRLKLDRNQGGDERGAFDRDAIDQLRGEFGFISDGLAMILAVADDWFDLVEKEPDSAVTVLAQKLMVNGFAGLEVGDLTYLIAGRRLNDEDESNLKMWVEGNDEKAKSERKNILGWRPVIDVDQRERLRKKRDSNEKGAK